MSFLSLVCCFPFRKWYYVSMSAKQSTVQKTPKQTEDDKNIGVILAIGAFILPLISWVAGVVANPSGWASDNPSIILLMLVLLAYEFWPVTLLVIIACIAACMIYRKHTMKIIGTFLMAVSVLYSAFLFHTVWTASDNEFSG